MFIRGKAVSSKAIELFSLMKDVLTDANLGNQKRVLEMLKESKARYVPPSLPPSLLLPD